MSNAEQTFGANFMEGRIHRHGCYTRDGKSLPMLGVCGWIAHVLGGQERTAREIIRAADAFRSSPGMSVQDAAKFPRLLIETMEALISDGWVVARKVEGHDGWPRFSIDESRFMHDNDDVVHLLDEA